MNDAFYIAAAGMRSEEFAVQVTANNIANMNTPGFKRSEVRFSELMTSPSETSAAPPFANAAMQGVMAETAPQTFQPGELRKSDNALDLAIDGQGFIEVLGADGRPMLWRGGRLKFDADGQLSTSSGFALKASIRAPVGVQSLTIDADGIVRGAVDGAVQDLGKIDLVLASDPTALQSLGDGLYDVKAEDTLTTVAPGADGAGMLSQGSTESSNVQLSQEMVTLMLMQRAFSANSQVIQAADQLMAIANGLKR